MANETTEIIWIIKSHHSEHGDSFTHFLTRTLIQSSLTPSITGWLTQSLSCDWTANITVLLQHITLLCTALAFTIECCCAISLKLWWMNSVWQYILDTVIEWNTKASEQEEDFASGAFYKSFYLYFFFPLSLQYSAIHCNQHNQHKLTPAALVTYINYFYSLRGEIRDVQGQSLRFSQIYR